jgi:hypothetical protein
MPEVGMAVDMDEPVTTASGERQTDGYEKTAVATQNQRDVSIVEKRIESVGESPTEVDDAILVAKPTACVIAVVDIPGGDDYPGIERPALQQPSV